MAEKVYQTTTVWEATQKRLEFIFREFDNICVAFSGGKDSGLVLNLVLEYAREHGSPNRLAVFHQDFEAQYTETTNYVTRTFRQLPEGMEKYWCCFPMMVENSLSVYEPWWYTWDADKPEIWARPMPQEDGVYSLKNNPFPWYRMNMLEEDFHDEFTEWFAETHSGRSVVLLGIRADESLLRYRSIAKKKWCYDGRKWTHRITDKAYTASPIYDWQVEDVWTANGKRRYDYNRLYDLFYKAGVPLHSMRVASPFLTEGRPWLNTYRIVDPVMWARLVGRVNGANFGAIYGTTKAVAYRDIKLPKGHTWESYTHFLLSTLPEATRQNYEKIFNTSMEFWKKTGGGMPEESIREAEELGYGFRENGTSPYSKDHAKKRMVIDVIPDDTDDIMSTTDFPSWKRMCMCILRNDYTCKNMGFAPTKEQQERINAIKAKYRSIARGGD